eukprot:3124023-Amphidinium_carterae.1
MRCKPYPLARSRVMRCGCQDLSWGVSATEVLEGYHSVGDYKSKKTANGRSGRTPRSVGVPWKEGSLRSEVTSPSTMSQKYVMYTS